VKAAKPNRRPLVPVNARGYTIGERHHRAKLTDHEVELVLELLDGGMSQAKVAEKFEISRRAVRDYAAGRSRCQSAERYVLATRASREREHRSHWHRPSRIRPADPEEFSLITYPEADPSSLSVSALSKQLQTSVEQLISLTLLGWLPPATDVFDGVPYWSCEAVAKLADAYGAWLALRVADDDASAIASAAVAKAAAR